MPSDVLLNRVREIVANFFNLPLEQVTPDSSPATIEAWESMASLGLTIELEQEFNISLTPEQTEQMKDVGAIAEGLADMGVEG